MTLYLCLYLIIEELLLEFGEGIITTVIIKVQRIQHISEEGKRFLSKMIHSDRHNWSMFAYTTDQKFGVGKIF